MLRRIRMNSAVISIWKKKWKLIFFEKADYKLDPLKMVR